MLKKIYQELVSIRRELQRIRNAVELIAENEDMKTGKITLDFIQI